MFPRYYMDGVVISSSNFQPHTDMLPVVKGLPMYLIKITYLSYIKYTLIYVYFSLLY